MDYGKIFTRSWEVFWNHKILWVFGLLSGIFGGVNGALSGFNYRYSFSTEDFYTGELPFSENTIEMFRWMTDNLVVFTAGLITFVLLFLFLGLLLGAFTSTGIIQGNLLLERGEEKLSWDSVVAAIKPYFWRVVGLSALLGVGGMGLVFVLMAVLIVLAIATFGLGMMCFFPLVCLLAPVTWFLTIVVTQAMITIIAEDLDIISSLQRGWRLVTSNLGPFLLVWLLVMVITFVIGIILSVPTYIAMAPMYASMFRYDAVQDPAAMFQAMQGGMIWMVIWVTIQSFLMGVFSVFTTSVWVQTYLEARGDGTLGLSEPPTEVEPDSDALEQTT